MPQGRSRVIVNNQQNPSQTAPSRQLGTLLVQGVFPWGPVQTPTVCLNEGDFISKFGDQLASYYSCAAVRWYFTHGGKRVIVNRVVHMTGASPTSAAKASYTLATDVGGTYSGLDTLEVEALYYGTFGNRISVKVVAASDGDADHFDLLVYLDGYMLSGNQGWYKNLSMLDTDARYAETIINTSAERSNYIRVTDQDVGGVSGVEADQRPVNLAAAVSLTGGDDGLTSLADADFQGSSTDRTGLYAFNSVTEGNLLITPDWTTSTYQNSATSYCENEKEGTVLFLPDAPSTSTTYTAVASDALALTESESRTKMFYPWIEIPNPSKATYGQTDNIYMPASCAVAARISRNIDTADQSYWSQPSNDTFGLLEGVVGLKSTETKDPDILDYLTDNGVNPLTMGTRPSGGNFGVWNNDCLLGKTDGNFVSIGEYLGVAELRWRFAAYLERHRTQPFNPERRRTIKYAFESELLKEMKYRPFASEDPSEAFVVDTDIEGTTINNPLVQEEQTGVCKVGVATQRPGRYLYLVFTRDDRAIKSWIQQQLASAGQ